MYDMFDFFIDTRSELERNMDILNKAEFPFRIANNGKACLFRLGDRPYADFYPSTGRWRLVENKTNRAQSGGAKIFLDWYRSAQDDCGY